MAEMKVKMTRLVRRALLLCLCMTLLAGSALANEVVDLCTEGYESIIYGCTLPDGRLIFTGQRGKVGNYADSRARIVCLNPDMTVSWDYFDPEEGACRYIDPVVLQDGTIGVVFDNSPYQNPVAKKLKFFTQDGQPTGKEISLGNGDCFLSVTDSFVQLEYLSDEAGIDRIDWQGNLIRHFEEDELPVKGSGVYFYEEDGMVTYNAEMVSGGCFARIFKMDYDGKVLWETVLPHMHENVTNSRLLNCKRTEDGGYLGLLAESDPDCRVWQDMLVKFSADGRLLWTNEKCFDGYKDYVCRQLELCKGKVVLQLEKSESDTSLDCSFLYLWTDENGNKLGTTELTPRKEDLVRYGNASKVHFTGFYMLVLGDDLWANGHFYEENRDYEKEMASVEELLYKVPEL